jgi:phosphatidylethanolamine/phosphatidyl-N-methylethanolamine N-methyltransferase
MSAASQSKNINGNRVVFLQEFLKHPYQVASIIPSSRFLEQRISQQAAISSAHTVVELGAGTGGTTRAMLRDLPRDAKLLVVEINTRFCELLRRIDDKRLIVHHGNAQDLQNALVQHGLPAPDVIVSGIPFSTMGNGTGTQILKAVAAALAPGGRFVAYQVSKQVDELASPLLGSAQVEVELFNIPPMRIYRWDKAQNAARTQDQIAGSGVRG